MKTDGDFFSVLASNSGVKKSPKTFQHQQKSFETSGKKSKTVRIGFCSKKLRDLQSWKISKLSSNEKVFLSKTEQKGILVSARKPKIIAGLAIS